jgi:pimeloyl-ACP methyl ester carboxylesterase
MSRNQPVDHLVWQTTEVGGRKVRYGAAGQGLPVLFVHGWALGSHSYKRALKRLVRLGCRVYAPALPGFGGSSGLPGAQRDLVGYAAWADGFLDAVGIDEPVLVVGHSFGGAVAAKLAHDFPDRVSYLVLVDTVGAGVWSQAGGSVRSLADRPLWDWAVNFPRDILHGRGALPVISAILEDAVPNLVHNPLGMWQAAGLARRADLSSELAALKSTGVPVLVLWGEGDTIVPRASFDALCESAGFVGELVPGGHSWLLANPDGFAESMASCVRVASAARAARAGLSRRDLKRMHAPGTGTPQRHAAQFDRAANE